MQRKFQTVLCEGKIKTKTKMKDKTPLKYLILFTLLLTTLTSHAQSKKELLSKNDELIKANITLEKSNSVLSLEVENLAEQIKRLEKELSETKEAEKEALAEKNKAIVAKDEAIKARELAMKAELETMRAKEVLLQEKQRMEELFLKETKGKSSLRLKSIAGRYYDEKGEKDKGYIDLYEDGTILVAAPKKEKEKSPINSITGTYKLRGNKITIILSMFTMTQVTEGRFDGNRLIVAEGEKKTVYIRE